MRGMKLLLACIAWLSLSDCTATVAGTILFTPVDGMTRTTGPPYPTDPVAAAVSTTVDGRKTSLGSIELAVLEAPPTAAPIFVVGDTLIGDLLLRIAPLDETGGIPGDPGPPGPPLVTSIKVVSAGDEAVSVINPWIELDGSFHLHFDSVSSGVGTAAYTMHWEELDGLEFRDVSVTKSSVEPNLLLLSFGLALTGTADPDYSQPLFTATTSGDFSPVPEPASLAIFGLGALGLVAGGVRRRRNRSL